MNGVPKWEEKPITELVLDWIKLNSIQYNSLLKNLQKIQSMFTVNRYEFSRRIKNKKDMVIELIFKWNNCIIIDVCPWKILSKKIVKWN